MFGAETIGRRDAGGATNLMMRLDGINLFIREPRPAENVTADGAEIRYTYDHFGVVVQDLQSAIEELRGKGVTILQEPRTGRPGTHVAFIEGPDHTRIEVLQRDVPVGA
jgi:catechol 2,3-dioxygenase-like lactoylglutathione lyase family enzyme